MSIAFERQGKELILTLAPEGIYTNEIVDALNKGEEWRISRCFTLSKKHFRVEDAEQNEIRFCIGTVYDEYTLIDSDVLGTEFSFFFLTALSWINGILLPTEIYQFSQK